MFPTGRETGSELPTMANGDLICSEPSQELLVGIIMKGCSMQENHELCTLYNQRKNREMSGLAHNTCRPGAAVMQLSLEMGKGPLLGPLQCHHVPITL